MFLIYMYLNQRESSGIRKPGYPQKWKGRKLSCKIPFDDVAEALRKFLQLVSVYGWNSIM